jgi:hypothetical protein
MKLQKSEYRIPKLKPVGTSGSDRLRTNRFHAWLQFILFVGCYVLLNCGYFNIPFEMFRNVIYYHGVVTVCADIINMIAPLEQVLA